MQTREGRRRSRRSIPTATAARWRTSDCDGVHVNWRQVEDGLAWCFTRYLKQPEVCLPLEKAAQESNKGLWRESKPQAPWEFRAAKRGQ